MQWLHFLRVSLQNVPSGVLDSTKQLACFLKRQYNAILDGCGSSESQKELESIKSNPERGLLCIDWKDDEPFEITGTVIDTNYKRLEVLLLPCNYLHTQLGDKGDSVNPECIPDL